jgi:probable F420-dependent oxidoreductase
MPTSAPEPARAPRGKVSGFRVYAKTGTRVRLSEIAAHAARAERLGYDGLAVPEAVHDALTAAAVALGATERLRVATSVVVAFARSPMVVAQAAWDLQEASGGRFELGLGSQVKGNIEGRYGMPWAAPVPRMREYVGALRAIFACWQDGTPLRFEGEHYRLTRMQPYFSPGPIEHPRIPIFLGGVGPAMTALAGESADGLMTHPTNSAPRYLREVIRPRLAEGAGRAGRDPAELALMVGPILATGATRPAVDEAREHARRTLAFLYSTPAYWPSLELFGWRDRGERLRRLTREGGWSEMAGVIGDDVLDAAVPTGTYDEIEAVLRAWYGGLTEWLSFPMPDDPAHDAAVARVVARLRGG